MEAYSAFVKMLQDAGPYAIAAILFLWLRSVQAEKKVLEDRLEVYRSSVFNSVSELNKTMDIIKHLIKGSTE